MAEVINLATFNLDTQAMVKNLSELQDAYFDLRKEQKSYTDQTKDVQKEIDKLTKKNAELSGSEEDKSNEISANIKQIESLTAKQKELYKSEQNLGVQMATVRKEINLTTTQVKAYQDAEGKTKSLIDLGNEALGKQIKSKNDARAANTALNNVANQLNPNIEEEARLLQELNDQMDKNTQFIKENSSATANQKSNVGNYTESIEEALKAQEAFNGGIGGFISQSSEAGGAGNILTGAFSTIRVGILGALKAGLAFIATPIGAVIAALAVSVGLVVGAFKLAKESLQSTEEGTQKLAVVTGAITGIFKGLFKVIKPLGLFLADVFIKALENVGAVAEKTMGLIADALEFVGAESAAKGIRNFTQEVKNASVASANLAKAEGELAIQQRQATKIQLDYQKQAEKLRQQRDDETKSISQRIAINNQLGQVLQKQSASELAIANKALQVANLKVKAEGQTTEALDQRAEALTNISDIQERITGQESEQLANLNSLRKEAADKQKELDTQAIDRALSKSKAEIDLFIAQQGFKKKSMEDQVKFNNTLLEKETADLKLQLKNKKISQIEYDAMLLQLKNDTLSKNTDLVIENAQIEVDAQIEKNQRILDNDKYLSDEQLRIKQEALTTQLNAETAHQALLLEKGKINQAEYDAAIAVIKAKSKVKSDELIAVNKVAEQEKALIDLGNRKIIEEDNFIAQAQIEKDRNAILMAQELASVEENGAEAKLIKDKYAQQEKDINQKVLDQKLSATADIFGGIAQILGENSKAGKAAAIAQATINTYQGVTSAWSAPAVLPQPFDTISKVVASGVALASGFKAIKQITATKSPEIKKPSYATGVIGLRGSGSGTTDNISANLSAGESVINARSTSMFANELSAINQAGGGVGINGASNILNQNDLSNNANNSQMVQMIAEAVAIGAEAGTKSGSQSGIKELSNDRKVMADAKF